MRIRESEVNAELAGVLEQQLRLLVRFDVESTQVQTRTSNAHAE